MVSLSDRHSEVAALVSAVYQKSSLAEVATLEPEDFYFESSRDVFEAILDIYNAGANLDIMSLRNRLIERGTFDKLGGTDFILKFAKYSPVYNIDSVVSAIRGLSMRRKVFEAACDIRDRVQDLTVDPDEVVNDMDVAAKSISSKTAANTETIEDITRDGIEQYSIEGNYVPTGFRNLDRYLMGLFRSELIVIGARPGVGKSALVTNIASKIAREKKVLFFSLEMRSSQIVQRMVSSTSGMSLTKIRRGTLTDAEKAVVDRAINEIKHLYVLFSDRIVDLSSILNLARKIHRHRGVDCVIVDYLQLVRVKSAQQRYVQVGEISRGLKLLANELNIPVVALSQLRRGANDKAPELSDLRESGDIEQDADVVMLMHAKEGDTTGDTWVRIAKNRSGEIARAKLNFRKDIVKFYDVEYNEYVPSGVTFGMED